MTIKSEVSFFSDFSKTTTTTLVAEYTFTIYIEPCIVSNYYDSVTIQTITYFIGDPKLVDGDYDFTQD